MHNFKTREEWLHAANLALADIFRVEGYSLPSDVQVTCGWPSKSAGRSSKQRIGECWPRGASKNNVNEVIISMSLDNPVEVLEVLIHELIHVIDDCQNGHKGPFRKMALAIGLEGKMTSTHAGDKLKLQLEAIASNLNTYPHGSIDFSNRKKQTTRMHKVTCQNHECEMVFRTSNKWVELSGYYFDCPICHAPTTIG
tara:strand:- start:406 stop:996 length:591 start_codon:yes stop_codon:yes gene_type:complete